ncbi:MAG TPA: YidC/Oxa1 family membrane protein insertase [Thermomicrobiales bacterium]|nr:YidC/Oxa1 family membrane protein insertase [Thermomicrobiales bacterium]
MLFDVLGSLFSLNGLFVGQFQHLITTMPLGSIPVWDQYIDLLKWILNHLGDAFSNGGLAIIAFTIIIKTLLLPLTVKSIRSSKNMQELAPKIKDIQKKYGKDRQRASQETMALYQQHGVNPMAGCLPMVLQIPIFFGLYHTISNLSKSGTGVWDGGFLWLSSLDHPDPYKILPIMAGVFQFVQARMMRPAGQKVTDPQQQIMNTMMNFMPLMVVLFGWNFSSGPVIYWVTQAIYSVVQQWMITGWGSFGEWFPWLPELPAHRRLGYQDPSKLRDVVVMSGEAGVVQQKGISGWLNRKMMEAQETAQERQKAQQEARGGSKSGSKAGSTSSTSRNGKASTANRNTRANAGKTTAKAEVVEEGDDDAVEEVINDRVTRRQSNYQSRVAGSKFGATRGGATTATAAAENGDGGDTAPVTTATSSGPRRTGKSRTKPQRRPTT